MLVLFVRINKVTLRNVVTVLPGLARDELGRETLLGAEHYGNCSTCLLIDWLVHEGIP